jgi:cell division protein FtsN
MHLKLPALTWSDRAIVGFVSGVVAGIALSTAAALYITNSPVPFVSKVQRATANVNPAAGGQLPDPNKPLYSNHAALPVPAPGSPSAASPQPGAAAPIEDRSSPAPPTAPAPAAAASDARLMLQTGAFKSAQDADSMRARLALLGLDARVSQVTQDAGATILYRVRIGPYRELDDLSGIRRTLSENGIEAQVVHTQ